MTRELTDYAIRLHTDDSVATALRDVPAGRYAFEGAEVVVPEPIRPGFKLALRDIDAGEEVRKYGYVIGTASEPIATGEPVHVNNLSSGV